MSQIRNDTGDESLLANYRDGSDDAFAQLFRRYSRRIFGYVLGIVGDADTADDVTQIVFVKLARRPEAYSPTASFSSWLHRVARNAAFDILKSHRNLVALEQLDVEKGKTESTQLRSGDESRPDEGSRVDSIESLLFEAIDGLEGAQRESLVLREYSELSYREISDITGRSLATVKQDIFQARRNLRRELAPHLDRTESE
jgi:RNA polymerase sigma-70 factor (ECF subfamily)